MANHFSNMQSWQRQVVSYQFQRDMRCVVRTNIKVSTRISDLLHTLREELSDR